MTRCRLDLTIQEEIQGKFWWGSKDNKSKDNKDYDEVRLPSEKVSRGNKASLPLSYQRKTTHSPNTGGKTYKPSGHQNGSPNRPNGGNDRPSGWTDRPSQNNQAGTSRGPYPQRNHPTTPLQCILCKGPHKVSCCPHRASLTTLQVSIQESNDTRVETMLDKKEDQDRARSNSCQPFNGRSNWRR